MEDIDHEITKLSSKLRQLIKKKNYISKGSSSSSETMGRGKQAKKSKTMVASVTKPRFDVNNVECFRCGERVT